MHSLASPLRYKTLLRFVFAVLISAVLLNNVSAQEKPNIILINLDDADTNLLSDESLNLRFPNLKALASRGLRFTNLHATSPLCGPSRACLLRGQYAHNTGIMVNEPAAAAANGMPGGVRLYRDQGYFDNDLSTWMQDAGYHTMLVGKYLHGDFVNTVPLGWDNFYAFMGQKYYEFATMSNEKPWGHWTFAEPGIYRTNAETARALQVIQAHADSDSNKPFFLYLCPIAPHNGYPQSMVDTARYGDIWQDVMAPMNKSYNEVDYSDKVAGFTQLAKFSYGAEVYLHNHYRDRLRATLSFDDQLGAVVEKLEELDKLDNTYIIVTSDNGFALGENRIFGKGTHFDRASRVPLLVVGPGITPDVKDHLLAHIDLTPTVLDIAGGTIPSLVDGNSFKQLIDNPNSVSERDWQESILIENWETRNIFGNKILCAANTLRRFDSVYTEHATGDFEYYDLSIDPMQLENIYPTLSSAGKYALARQLRSLKSDDGPKVGVSFPFANDETFQGEANLSGIVNAPYGVSAVRLAIRDQSSGEWWNGSNWQSDFLQLSADVGRTGAMVSTWSYTFRPGDGVSRGGVISSWTWGYDFAGRYTKPPVFRTFTLEASTPSSKIIRPRTSTTVSGNFEIAGTATSVNQVDHVRLIIRRKSDAMYYNGSSFQTAWMFRPVSVGTDGTWSLTSQLPAGEYFVSTYAVDNSGAREPSPQINLFRVN